MLSHFASVTLVAVIFVSLAHAAKQRTAWVTPHDSYSSSIGVLGCKINTDRVAYWPNSVDCNNVCIELSYQDRSVKLLRIDQSQGAHDVSYDAWNYLYTGHSARKKPAAGGAVEMQYKYLEPSECSDLLLTPKHKLPLSAPNSMNFLASCLQQANSWVSKNYVLYNILDSICTFGIDQQCALEDWPNANQPVCPSTLGQPRKLSSAPVYDVKYPSGQVVVAGSNEPADKMSDSSGSDRLYRLPMSIIIPIGLALQ